MSDTGAQPTIDELLDRAVRAMNRGDRQTADALAGRVLAVDGANPDAEELLAAPSDHGEIRRLTIFFADLVDSTALSTRVDLEVYRTVVGRYRDEVLEVVNRYEGHIGSTKGDGLLAVFGHPKAHENDAHRAVQAGLDLTRQVTALSQRVRRSFGFDINVRVGIHRGLVYLDTEQDDVYGLGANLAARMCSLADPDTVAVSDAIARVVRDQFELAELTPKAVKGVEGLIVHHRVVGERDVTTTVQGPLIGRERELAHLRESWAQASAGTLTTRGVAFCGDGGIGKTRLAYAAVEMAQQAGAEVLGLFGSPFHTDVGLRPVRRLLERRCGIERDSDPDERLRRLHQEVAGRALDPATVTPLLAPVLGIGPESGYEPAHAGGAKLHERITGAIHDYLLACIGNGPGLILADDIHWFDEDTIDVVQALLSEDRGGLLVVITGRSLPSLAGTAQFDLAPLSPADTDKLVLALHPDMAPDARSAVQERCDGIPLYIEEVVAKLKEQPSDLGQLSQVPDTLYETLFARLRSSPNTLPVVEAAALIGSRFDRKLLASVTDLDQREVDDILAELSRGRVLAPLDKDSWRFYHELLREVAAEVSPPTVRRRLHSRIADALLAAAADANPEWSLVAQHFEAAERYNEAAQAYQRAAADARRRGALNEARAYLARTLHNIGCSAPGRARDRREIAVRLESGFLASAAQGHASTDAAGEFERCLQLIGDDPSPELYATLNALWSYYTARGDLRRGTQVAESLRTRLEGVAGVNLGATAAVMGVLAGFRGDFHTARDTLERAAAGLTDADMPEMKAWYAPNDPIAGMYSFLAFTRFVQGDLTGAGDALRHMGARCDRLGFPHGAFSLCYGRSIEAWIRGEAGQRDRGAELADELASLAQRYSFDEWVMVAWSMQTAGRALRVLDDGDAEPAALAPYIDEMTTVVQTWRAFNVMTFLAFYDGVLARLLTAAGQREAARERLDIALKMSQDTWIQFCDAELLRLRADTLDDPDARLAQLRTAIDLARHQGAYIFELSAAADYFELAGESARQELTTVASRFSADESWPELNRARALLR